MPDVLVVWCIVVLMLVALWWALGVLRWLLEGAGVLSAQGLLRRALFHPTHDGLALRLHAPHEYEMGLTQWHLGRPWVELHTLVLDPPATAAIAPSGATAATAPPTPPPSPLRRPILVYAHGNAGQLNEGRVQAYRTLAAALQVTVVAFDYAGFGASKLRDDTLTLSEMSILADGRSVLAFAKKLADMGTDAGGGSVGAVTGARTPHTPAGGRPIWVWGESMGSAVAAHLAADPAVAGVVLHIGFARLQDVAARLVGPALAHGAQQLLDDPLDNAADMQAAPAAAKPACVIVATDDEIMPPTTADALVAALRRNPQRRVQRFDVSGTHNRHDLQTVLPRVAAFMRADADGRVGGGREESGVVN